jgi:hypothetical protein
MPTIVVPAKLGACGTAYSAVSFAGARSATPTMCVTPSPVVVGQYLAGATYTVNRGFISFDLTGVIPSAATAASVYLALHQAVSGTAKVLSVGLHAAWPQSSIDPADFTYTTSDAVLGTTSVAGEWAIGPLSTTYFTSTSGLVSVSLMDPNDLAANTTSSTTMPIDIPSVQYQPYLSITYTMSAQGPSIGGDKMQVWNASDGAAGIIQISAVGGASAHKLGTIPFDGVFDFQPLLLGTPTATILYRVCKPGVTPGDVVAPGTTSFGANGWTTNGGTFRVYPPGYDVWVLMLNTGGSVIAPAATDYILTSKWRR